jgi:hypothetical protein
LRDWKGPLSTDQMRHEGIELWDNDHQQLAVAVMDGRLKAETGV